MAFTVGDVQDLLRLLREHPEWRAEVRREVLGEELLSLPDLVRQNSEDIRELQVIVRQNSVDIRELQAIVRQNSVDIRELQAIVRQNSVDIRELQAIVRQNSEDIRELQAIVRQNSEDIRQNSEDIRALQAAVAELVSVTRGMHTDVGKLKGSSLEYWYREHPEAITIGRLRKIRVVRLRDLDLVDAAEESGVLTTAQLRSLGRLDLIVSGREGSGADARDTLLAVETSYTIDEHDVIRARDRAEMLRIAGYNAHAAVAGEQIADPIRAYAREQGVEVFLKGGDFADAEAS
ncbi:MAG: hypothetical protein HYX53_02280 [Chloroflexi bacterium]|nr:hypothetical protein [Chloroflexota bacterium]